MSKKSVNAVSKESGAYAFGKNNKNHDKPAHAHGPVETGKHEKPLKEQGSHIAKNKPLVHVEDVNTHSGRPHPPATKLADSKALVVNAYPGKLRKSDNV